MNPTPVRVVIAEDSALLREGLVRLLEHAGYDVLAAVADAEELLRAVDEHDPALVVVDVRMPPTFTSEGIRAALVLRQTRPELAVMVLSQYVEEQYAAELIGGRSAGLGYLLKDRVADVAEFTSALAAVAAGGTSLDPEVVRQLLARGNRRDDALERLTPREREVLQLMAEGRTNTAIARAMVVTPGAVEKHISNIFTKLDLPATTDDHRRVLAVLTFLRAADGAPG